MILKLCLSLIHEDGVWATLALNMRKTQPFSDSNSGPASLFPNITQNSDESRFAISSLRIAVDPATIPQFKPTRKMRSSPTYLNSTSSSKICRSSKPRVDLLCCP